MQDVVISSLKMQIESIPMVKGKASLLSDEEIVRLIIEDHDQQLFDELYNRYAKKVFHKCILITKARATSEDLTHDVMVKVLTNIHKLKAVTSFSLWVYTITYNTCMDYLRYKKKIRFEDYQSDKYDNISIDQIEAENRELKELQLNQLETLFEHLTAEEKMILLMRYQDGLSVKQVAQTLNIGESAVKMRLKRSRDRLGALLKDLNV